MKIIGLDISGGSATAVFLNERPENILLFSQSESFTHFEIEPTLKDLEGIQSLEPDLIVLEPSGGHYERVFTNWFSQKGLNWRRAVGYRVDGYRKDQGLHKTDPLDALLLACYGFDKLHDPRAWIQECELPELRELGLQRFGLVKIQKRYIQKIRQQLEHEFPEAATKQIKRDWREPPVNGLINWIADGTKNKSYTYWQKTYEGGVRNRGVKGKERIDPGTIGSGLTSYTRMLAVQLTNLWNEILEIEDRCDEILKRPELSAYIEAMDYCELNRETQVFWITRIYPFDRFLADKKERKVKRVSRRGKLCVHNLSLSQFKAALGAGTIRNESGARQVEKRKTKRRRSIRKTAEEPRAEYVSGDRHSRRSYFMWFIGKFEGRKSTNVNSEGVELIRERNRRLLAERKNVFQRSCNCQGYTAKLVYQQLKKKLL